MYPQTMKFRWDSTNNFYLKLINATFKILNTWIITLSSIIWTGKKVDIS